MHTTLKMILDAKGPQIYAVAPDSTVQQAAQVMAGNGVGAVLVRREDQVVGILSERDLLNKVSAKGRVPAEVRVDQVMTDQVVTVGSGVTLNEALQVVTERRLRHLPVIDEGRLVGLVSSGDLARWLVKDQAVEITDLVNYVKGNYPA